MLSISVIIPTYNNGHLIVEAIESVLSQSISPVEVIIVDDGSTDNTRQILEPYIGHIRYHYQENQGLAVARNVGLDLASGDYLTFLDADDIWLPDNLEIKTEVLRCHPDLGGVFSEFEIFGEQGVLYPEGTRNLFPFFKRTGKGFSDIFQYHESLSGRSGESIHVYRGHIFDSLFLGNFILPSSMVFNRHLAVRIGQFKPHMRTQQDYEYWLRFSREHSFAYIDKVLVRYRRHPQQLTDFSKIERIISTVLEIINGYEEEFMASNRVELFRWRKAGVMEDLAKVHIRNGDGRKARELLSGAIGLNPLVSSRYFNYLISYLPYSFTARMRRLLRSADKR